MHVQKPIRIFGIRLQHDVFSLLEDITTATIGHKFSRIGLDGNFLFLHHAGNLSFELLAQSDS